MRRTSDSSARLTEKPRCWLCGSATRAPWGQTEREAPLTAADIRISDKHYGTVLPLVHCLDCGFIHTSSGQVEKLDRLYGEMTDSDYLGSFNARRVQMRHLLDTALRAHPEAKSVLDIGAGAGALLVEAQARGLTGVGVEPSQQMVEHAKRLGLQILEGVFPHPGLEGQRFDLIFLVDIIEHVSDPIGVLKSAAKLLTKNGKILLVTPDVKSLSARLLGGRWWHFRLAHVSYFDRNTLLRAAQETHTQVRSWFRPTWYFPVDYLVSRLAAYRVLRPLFVLLRGMSKFGVFSKWVVPLNLFDSWGVILEPVSKVKALSAKKPAGRPSLKGHLKILRVDHWIKNVFVIPGIVLAIGEMGPALTPELGWKALLALAATCLLASSNYVINEILDAPFDRTHPTKYKRPVPNGEVNIALGYIQWLALAGLALAIGASISTHFTVALASLWIMGCVYNIPPLRSKDRLYIDVLSEAINNPIRLLLGWYAMGITATPPLSLLLSYWMVGCYFMALKRYAELRELGQGDRARQYRPSLAAYTPEKLIVTVLFYACSSMLFFGAFGIRYRFELILTYPLLAAVMAVYFQVALKKDSAAQSPEKLYRERWLLFLSVAFFLLFTFLSTYPLPWVEELFKPSIPTHSRSALP